MKNVIRIAIVDPADSSRATLKNLLLGIDSVWLEAKCSNYEYFADVAMQTQPDIALISLDADPDKALELIGRVSQELPSCSTLVVSSSQEGSLILKAMRNGAKEFLNFPLNLEDFLAALDRIQLATGARSGDAPAKASQVVTVSGVSGGVGCTSLAINLACVLAQDQQNNVAIIDLDLALGDADVWLDIIPDYTIQDVAENIGRLDYALLKRSLTKHDCGAFLLPRPVHMDLSPSFSPDELRRVIALLRATFTHLVIDISKMLHAARHRRHGCFGFNSADDATRSAVPEKRRPAAAVLRSARSSVRQGQSCRQPTRSTGHSDQLEQGVGNNRPRCLLAGAE
jgi:pilus assembly protein CpaE